MAPALKRLVGKTLFTVFFLIPLALLVEIPVFVAGAALGTYLVYSKDLPQIPKGAQYQPRTVSTFFSDDGTVIGSFYKQRRVVIDLDQIPQPVINAFLAAEDRRFFEHHGVDWMGFGRALVRTAMAGHAVQGGSTITMQVTRNFFLTREKRISRKVREMALTSQLEKYWGKKKILYIYLNEIYLGEGAYGVEAASREYFDKPVQHLSIAEAALLAGLVASPARYNPFKNMELATKRQATVLQRMLRAGFITEAQYRSAKEEPLRIKKEIARPFDLVPDFAEAVRRYILKKYGEEKLYHEGLKVFTTVRIDYQRKAVEAMEKGLGELKARQKHLAILRTIPKEEIAEFLQGRRSPQLTEGKIYQGIVTKVIPLKNKEADLQVALTQHFGGRVHVRKGAAAYKYGHLLALRFERFVDDVPYFVLDEDPQLQGAFVCIENNTGYVRALVGGASGELFQFNRAIQAKRQPGSAFKPLVYAAALEGKSYSPATIIVDEPIEVELEAREDEPWEPKNAEGGFLGPLSFRRALELSRNICTIKILMDVGYDPVIELARKLGITASLGRNLSLSLGTSEMSLFQLTSAYTAFPNGGIYVRPVMVKRVEDRFGDVLEDNTQIPVLDESEIPRPVPREELRNLPALYPQQGVQDEADDEEPEQNGQPAAARQPSASHDPAQEQEEPQGDDTARVHAAMSPQTAYIMTSLLQGGVRTGTGARMSHYVKRKDLAGKTGTTNRAEDTWFVGFSPHLTAGVWVGYDEKRPLGSHEAGGRAALPIWAYFMKSVLDNTPDRDFPVPPDIAFQQVVTFAGSAKEGFVPTTVTEPVYKPFAGKTLVLSPLDSPETLASYRLPVPGVPFNPPGAEYPPGPYQQPGVMPPPQVQPAQIGPVMPLRPLESREPAPAPQGRRMPAPVQAPAGYRTENPVPRSPGPNPHYPPPPAR
jgi:penicillin-binding protein 1A